MSDAKTTPVQSEQPRSMQLCHVILETVNAQEIPVSQRSELLDGMLMAYLTVANIVGLVENAALVITAEGARILRHLHDERHEAAKAASQGAAQPAAETGTSAALKAAAEAGEVHAPSLDPEAVMDSIRQAA